MGNYLIDLYNNRKINYDGIGFQKTNVVSDRHVTFSVIIPVMNRVTFHKPLVKYLKEAAMHLRKHGTNKYTNVTFAITFVEHSHINKHGHLAKASGVNHIWIPKKENEPFNKCLSMNMGVLKSNPADYYIFHDIDLLMHWDFFYNILQNFERCRMEGALQTFGGRRVIPMDQDVSYDIINQNMTLHHAFTTRKMEHSIPGAPGGSICVKARDFFNVGGYDAEFFHSYSPEDRFFWRKMEMTCGIQGCDDPLIESYHMWHPSMEGSNPDRDEMHEIIHQLEYGMELQDKMNYIYHIAKEFKKFRK